MANDPICAICGCDMTGDEHYDDTCDDCAKNERLLLDEEDDEDGEVS